MPESNRAAYLRNRKTGEVREVYDAEARKIAAESRTASEAALAALRNETGKIPGLVDSAADRKYELLMSEYNKDRAKWQEQVDSIVGQALMYDIELGEYVNIEAYFYAHRDNLRYTVRIPKYSTTSSTQCAKMDANAGLVVEPSTNEVQGRDDYVGRNAFSCYRCNGFVDADGVPHVTAIEGDTRFRKDGSNGDVWVLAPTLFWRFTEDEQYHYLSISDGPSFGYDTVPGGLLPNGNRRPFMLYAAYAGGNIGGKLVSASGLPLWNRTYSHNASHGSMVTGKGAGYSGKTLGDDWYVKAMFLLKYAEKSSQKVFAGCTGYTTQATVSVGESNTNRVIIPTSSASALLVGSSVMCGKTSTDRSAAGGYDVFDARRIVSMQEYDQSNTAVYVEGDAFSTESGYKLSTAPWHSGSCDGVLGTDGTPSAAGRTSSKEPFRIQNIEVMVGAYEILSDVIMRGSAPQEHWVCRDCAKYATSITENYEKVGSYAGGFSQWNYTLDVESQGGLLSPHGKGGSTTTGLGDGYYLPGENTTTLYEWRGFGALNSWSHAGLWYVTGSGGLGDTTWDFAGRLSAIGRSAA